MIAYTRPVARPAGPCLLGAMLLPALFSAAAPARAASPPAVTLQDAFFLRASTGPLFGFFTIDNEGDKPLLITDWASPACKSLKLEESGASSTQKTSDELTVPPRTKMVFAPGGYHLLCDAASPTAGPGTTLDVTATFMSGRTLTQSFAIRAR